MGKLKFKEQMAINKATTSKEQMFVARLDNEEKVRLYNILTVSESDFKAELRNMMYEDNPEAKAKAQEKYESKIKKEEGNIQKFFEKQGMPNPSETTRKAFEQQQIETSINKTLNFLSMFKLSIEAQSNASFYNAQLKQNFIAIAQNDEIIKQNDKIVEQNEIMIRLMEQMVNK